MEKRINKKVEHYVCDFKNNIRNKITEIYGNDNERSEDLIKYIYNFERLVFDKEDFNKRRRIKNSVPITDRCCAKRANDEQCTRRKKQGYNFCGTHIKGIPNGEVDNTGSTENYIVKELQVVEQSGIARYVCGGGSVYDAEKVLNGAYEK
jgi:hypothetical protein